jgi:Lytic polysaccharide mono-oxygenase, cellulose-degrading
MKLTLKSSVVLSIVFISSLSWGHARLVSPTPRSNDSGIKSGPCGGLARSANPMVLQGGQSLAISWQETVNHPGKFLFALSMANDNFTQNLASVTDNQNGGGLPHSYSTIVAIPNINCETCTIQMIQSMEENPNAPSYYYSCADVRIVATSGSGTGGGGGNNAQGGAGQSQTDAPKMGGCGLVKEDLPPPPPSMKYIGAIAALALMPIAMVVRYRYKAAARG